MLLHPTDQPFYDAMSQVCAATLKGIGVNVDDAAMDWGTVVQRRNSKEPLDKGGWSLFCTSFPALDYTDPLARAGAARHRRRGLVRLADRPQDRGAARSTGSTRRTTDGRRKRLRPRSRPRRSPRRCSCPLGQYFQSAAWRSNITGQLKAQPPLFWNVAKG